MTPDFVLCRSDQGDGGWSLHAPGATDEDIASGDAPYILSGEAAWNKKTGDWNRPNAGDYAEAARLWPGKLYTVTAANRYFWQKLAVMAHDDEAASVAFRAYLDAPAQQDSEAYELSEAHKLGVYDEGAEELERESYRYWFDDDTDVEEGDETEIRHKYRGALDETVRMIASGGNG